MSFILFYSDHITNLSRPFKILILPSSVLAFSPSFTSSADLISVFPLPSLRSLKKTLGGLSSCRYPQIMFLIINYSLSIIQSQRAACFFDAVQDINTNLTNSPSHGAMDNPELLPQNKALYNTWWKKLPDGKSAVFSGVTDSKISKSSAIQTLIWFENLSWLMDSLWIPEKQALSWRKNVSVLDSGPEILLLLKLPMDPDCLTWVPHHDWESNIPFVLRKDT